jgi:hypothetical protein
MEQSLLKAFKWISVFTIALLLVTSVKGYVDPTGLLAQYNFTSQLNDSLGLHNGTASGSVLYITNATCPVANRTPCYYSAGSGTQFTIANTSFHRAGVTNLTSFTFNYWAKEADISNSRNDRHLWMNNTNNNGNRFQIISGGSAGTVYAQLIPITTAYSLHFPVVPTAQVAYMRSVVYDGTNLSVYLDGVLVNSTSYSGGLTTTHRPIEVFGSLSNGAGASLHGSGDEFTAWSRALTSSEIATLYSDYLLGYGPGESPPAATLTTGDIYLSKIDGDDLNSGNSSHPIKTINKLRSFNTAKKTIYFDQRAGNFWDLSDDFFLNSSVIRGGNSTHYTTLTCYNCDTSAIPRPTIGGTRNTSASDWTQISGSLWMYNPSGHRVANIIYGPITVDEPVVGFRLYYKDTAAGRAGWRMLNQTNWWWQNMTVATGFSGDYKVFVNSTANPITTYGEVRLVMADHGDTRGVCLQWWSNPGWDMRYINITKLHFRGCDVGVNSDRDFIMITNTTWSYIGGGHSSGGGSTYATRWGNAIQAWNDADNWSVTYNKLYEVYDAALTSQGTSSTGLTPTNHDWSYNKMWNVAYCFEHYYTPTDTRSLNISYHHNTCYNIGEGWYKRQRANYLATGSNGAWMGQSDQTASPKGMRFGDAKNVRNLQIYDNIFYNSSTHMYGFQNVRTDNPGWNNTLNYSINYNAYYKILNPQFNVSVYFNTPGQTPSGYSSLTSYNTATVHDRQSVETSASVFSQGPPYLIPSSSSGVCTASSTGSFIGAESCATPVVIPVTSTLLITQEDAIYTNATSVNDLSGEFTYTYDGNLGTGVLTSFATTTYYNFTNPGNLRTGESYLVVKESFTHSDGSYLDTRTINLPTDGELTGQIQTRGTYTTDTSGAYLLLEYYNGSAWNSLTNLPSLGYSEISNHHTYEIGANLTRNQYLRYLTPRNASYLNVINAHQLFSATRMLGGSVNISQYVYNQSGSLIAQFNSTETTLSTTYTFPSVGNYTLNSTAWNATHYTFGYNYTVYVYGMSGGTISNGDINITTRYGQVNWTNWTSDNLAGQTTTAYAVSLYTLGGERIRRLELLGLTNNLTIDWYNQNLSITQYKLRVTAINSETPFAPVSFTNHDPNSFTNPSYGWDGSLSTRAEKYFVGRNTVYLGQTFNEPITLRTVTVNSALWGSGTRSISLQTYNGTTWNTKATLSGAVYSGYYDLAGNGEVVIDEAAQGIRLMFNGPLSSQAYRAYLYELSYTYDQDYLETSNYDEVTVDVQRNTRFNLTAVDLSTNATISNYTLTLYVEGLNTTINVTTGLTDYDFIKGSLSAEFTKTSYDTQTTTHTLGDVESALTLYVATYYLTVAQTCTGLSTAMIFNLADEEGFTNLNGTVNYNFAYGLNTRTTRSVYGTIANTQNLSLCINSTTNPYLVINNGEVHYNVSGYVDRRYYLFNGTLINNQTTNITLHNLLLSRQTSFKLEVETNSMLPYVDKYTALLRWYPGLNDYRIVEMGLTDDTGSTVIHAVPEDVDYRIGVYERDGTIIRLANPIRLVCLQSPCTYTLKISGTTIDYNSLLKVQYTLDFNYTTGVWTFTYNDPSQTTSTYNLTIYRMTPTNTYSVCESTSTGYTGAMNCETSEYTGILKAVVTKSNSPGIPLASKLIEISREAFANNLGIFLTMLLVLPVVFIFAMVSPVAGIIGAVIALIPAWYFGSVGVVVITAFAVMAGVTIHFIKRVN